ncbi:hypothetical protein C445_20986 [Halobiforma lacisalsi AJ5]|uniref:Uncharacterized protein n=1 Tax=Natronobacterium lacisalsi AJ5 TaxID=358396 RepID=M0L0Z3_NATLA|nr:hypothetical protein C445_20986 [Halobiforma lacisalsi AJ5]
MLTDYGLVKKIGPKNKSGLYEITPRGETAIRMQDLYREVDDFEIILEEAVPNQKQQSAATD